MAELKKNIFFRKGTVEGLKTAPLIEGSVNFTTDEPAIYLDIAKADGSGLERKRIGDIIQVNKIKDIVATVSEDGKTLTGVATDWQGRVSEWSESALYYAIKENALLKYKKPADGETVGTWIQINATSDVEANLTALSTKVDGIQSTVTAHTTAIETNTANITNITKADGLIATAKQEAINAAATDATTKADQALEDAKDYVNSELKTGLAGKVDNNTFQNTVATLATIEYVDDEIADLKSESIDPLSEKIGKTALENDGTATGIYGLIATEQSRAEAKEKELNNAITSLGNTVSTTYETKTDAQAKLQAAKDYTDALKNGEVAQNAKDIAANTKAIEEETSRAKAKEATLESTINGINTAISELDNTYVSETEWTARVGSWTTDTATGTGIRKEIEDKISATKTELTTSINNVDKKVDNLTTVVNGKVSTEAFNLKVEELNTAITEGDAAAKTYAEQKASAAQTTAISEANKYTDAEVVKINTALNGKASTAQLTETKAELEGKITNTETTVKAYADQKAAAAEGAAKGYTDQELVKAKEVLNAAIAKKLDTDTFTTTLGTKGAETPDPTTIYGYIEAQDDIVLQAAKDYADDVLEAADAMTFIGVLGGTGNIQELPSAADTKAGDTYKIGAAGSYAGWTCYVGDLLIAKNDGSGEYYHISSGYEDDYSEYLNADTANATVTLKSFAGEGKGNIKFVGEQTTGDTVNGGISVTVTATTDDETQISNSTVSIGMYWGEF